MNLQAAQFNQIMQSGLQLHQEIDVPRGEVYLRIGVNDLPSDRVGSLEIPLQVPRRGTAPLGTYVRTILASYV